MAELGKANEPPAIKVGTRRSYEGGLCTIRFFGKLEGEEGLWLGVEWDNPSRGLHAGQRRGIKYFSCKSKSPKAGSFLRPTRAADKPRGFREALQLKYVSSSVPAAEEPIQISGKTVEEVGFDRIRKQLAELQELKIAILDGMLIRGVSPQEDDDSRFEELEKIKHICPKVVELDLGRNLISDFSEIMNICEQFSDLRRLKLDGNRFNYLPTEKPLPGILELSLDETLLSWAEISLISHRFPGIHKLSLSSNQLSMVSMPISPSIRDLSLESNDFESLQSLSQLSTLPNLLRLSVRRNQINKMQDVNESTTPFSFSSTLTTLDISLNQLGSWAAIEALPVIFPGLTNLRISGNPVYDHPPAPSNVTGLPETKMSVDEAYMLTIARLSGINIMNYSKVSPQDRTNGELYYLSLIGKELSAHPARLEKQILSAHPRYPELCRIHGAPQIRRTDESNTLNTRSLASHLVSFTFYMQDGGPRISDTASGDASTSDQRPTEEQIEIPRSFDIYRIKAIVARRFSLPPLGFKLIWETEEWDPIDEGTADQDEWDSSDEGGSEANMIGGKGFIRREEEFVDSTRPVEHWLNPDTREARVRIEIC